MAETLTKAELDRAREELRKVNEQHGFRRAPQDSPKGPGQPEDGGDPTPVGTTQHDLGQKSESPPDPGPARFIGIDLDHKAAGLSGGGVIPIGDVALAGIVDILLGELRASLDNTLKTVANNHRKTGPAQLELFENGRDPA